MTKKKSNILKFPSPTKKVRGKKAKEKLIIESMPLVKIVARKIERRTPPNIEFDDLVSCGVMGLIDAIEKFDPERGTKFKTYAEHRIKGAMLDELRAQDWVPRSIRKKEKIIAKSISKLESNLGRKVTPKDISKDLDIEQEKVFQMLKTISPATVICYDDYANPKIDKPDQQEQESYFQKLNKMNPFIDVSRQSSKQFILKKMRYLTESEHRIMHMYYFESKNLKEISEKLGITESRVSQLHMRPKVK